MDIQRVKNYIEEYKREFNEETEQARIKKIIGDLSDICIAPINYKVKLT